MMKTLGITESSDQDYSYAYGIKKEVTEFRYIH